MWSEPSAEWRSSITFLRSPAKPLLTQLRMLSAAFAARARCWPVLSFVALQDSPGPSAQSCFLTHQPPARTPAWCYSSPNAALYIPSVELHEAPLSPFLQPVKLPLNGSTTLWCLR